MTVVPEPAPSGRRWPFYLGLVAVLLVGLFFRVHDLGKECFDCDELYMVYVQGTSPKAVGTVMARDALRTNHPPLMTVPYLYWTALVGTREAAVRTLPLLLGLFTIVLTYRLGANLGGPLAGLLSAAALAINPIHIAYSQEARHYALLVLLTVVAHLLLLRCVRAGMTWYRTGYLVVCLIAMFTHYFAIPVLASHGVLALWLVYRGDTATRRNALQAAATLGLAIVPFVTWLPVLRHQATRPWPHLAEGTTVNILSTLRPVAGLGHGAACILPSLAALTLIAVALVANRRRLLPASPGSGAAPLPRWVGLLLVVGGLATGGGLYLIAPRLILPVAEATLATHEKDPLVMEQELHLLHYMLTALPLSLAVIGTGALLWPWLLRLGERLPSLGHPRCLSVAVFLGLLLGVPLVFVRLVGLLGVPFVQESNLQVLAPIFSLAFGLGLTALLRGRWGWIAAGVTVLGLGLGAVQYETVASAFGGDGIRLGTHTSPSWRDVADALKTGPDAKLPLIAAKTFETDPMLYYFAGMELLRIKDIDELRQPGSPRRFRFLHYEGDGTSTQLLYELHQANAQFEPLLQRDVLTVFVVNLGQPPH